MEGGTSRGFDSSQIRQVAHNHKVEDVEQSTDCRESDDAREGSKNEVLAIAQQPERRVA